MNKPVEITEINAVEPAPFDDPYYDVELIRGGVVGNKVHPTGARVKLPERAAIGAIKAGAAKPHGVRATIILGQYVPVAPSSKPAPVQQTMSPNIRIVSGSLLQDGRSYGPGETLHYRGDAVRLIAESSPLPGSKMEAFSRTLSRHRAIVEPVIPLRPEDSARLARLRRTPSEPMPDELAAARGMAELLGLKGT
jgi:hypothetical protein